jgi:uncharacterized protein YaaR (DUF327 family)
MAMKVKTGEDGLKNLDDYKSTAEFLRSSKSKATYASYKSSINHFIRFTAPWICSNSRKGIAADIS